jgi:hypothetical protein
MGEDVFLQVEQIIPLPETKEFMIDAQEKQKEENDKSKTIEESEIRLVKFWSQLKNKLRDNKIDFLERVSSKPHYSLGFWKGSGKFAFCIGKQTFRVELYFSNDPNKEMIDAMAKYKDVIESNFNGLLTWERLDNKKASRIRFDMPLNEVKQLEGRFSEEIYWNNLINWYQESMVTFYNAVNPVWEKVQKEL